MNKINVCRVCRTSLKDVVLDLGVSPLANSYIPKAQLQDYEIMYPLKIYVCPECFLVQTEDYEAPDKIFSNYAYFSSFSDSWLAHCQAYVSKMVERFSLNEGQQIIEIASNDGYLLQYFSERNIPVLGIEPAENVAQIAVSRGIPTVVDFFGERLAKELTNESKGADLLLGNNVLAHVPDLNDFVAGMKIVLNPEGVITMEFPHLLNLLDGVQFDTIYHEHYSYLSLTTVCHLFNNHSLTIFDVDKLNTHGGSLRIYAKHSENEIYEISPEVEAILSQEKEYGIKDIDSYKSFKTKVSHLKLNLLSALIEMKQKGKTIVGYGAPAKGNTLLNYCGVGTDFIDYTVDRSPHKQGCFLPGTRIPVLDPSFIMETKPDYLFILPWNLKDEIISQTAFIREWGGKWLIPIPELMVIE